MLWLMMIKLFAGNTPKLVLGRGCSLQGDSPYRAQSKHVAGSSLGSQANEADSFITLFSWET